LEQLGATNLDINQLRIAALIILMEKVNNKKSNSILWYSHSKHIKIRIE